MLDYRSSISLSLLPLRFTSSLAQKGRKGEHEEYPVGRGRLEPVGVSWQNEKRGG